VNPLSDYILDILHCKITGSQDSSPKGFFAV
jgi:hypothetical protein